MQSRVPKGGNLRQRGSQTIVCEGQERASTEATLDQEDGDQEEIRKEEE